MARQRIHNQRSGTGAGNAGASWISYSDLMAALLLVFVLMLSYSLYQYLTVLESTKSELEAQQAKLDQQQIILLGLQEQMDAQSMQLANQQVQMDNQSALIIIMQGELDGKQAQLDLKEDELTEAYIVLANQQAELNSNRIALSAAQTALEEQKQAFLLQTQQLSAMVGVKAEIISEISGALSARRVEAKVDPNSGDIVIDSNMLTFETGKSELTAESKAFLNTFIPVYMEVLMRPEYRDYLGSIIIEGHTDQQGTYEVNMELSQQRALEVLLYIRNMYRGDSAMLARLDQIMVATGKGYSEPKYNAYGYIDASLSRRVEFKFSLRDAEMIEEINRLLNGQ